MVSHKRTHDEGREEAEEELRVAHEAAQRERDAAVEAAVAVAVGAAVGWRRRQLPRAIAVEVVPRNMIMLGPTGVGKTEIARRLATLVGAPFVKVEATKFTEVGYVGRDVESMIRDLLEVAIRMVRQEQAERVRDRAEELAKDRLISILLGERSEPATGTEDEDAGVAPDAPSPFDEGTTPELPQAKYSPRAKGHSRFPHA